MRRLFAGKTINLNFIFCSFLHFIMKEVENVN